MVHGQAFALERTYDDNVPFQKPRSYTMDMDLVFAQIAAEGIKTWYPGVPGGTAFDKRLQKEYREFLRLKGVFGEMQVLGHPDAVRA